MNAHTKLGIQEFIVILFITDKTFFLICTADLSQIMGCQRQATSTLSAVLVPVPYMGIVRLR
jgi:hypothetical protein